MLKEKFTIKIKSAPDNTPMVMILKKGININNMFVKIATIFRFRKIIPKVLLPNTIMREK